MANYNSLNSAINAGITNMTVVRNNSANDDGVDTIATGIDWFYFNSVQVTNLYVSGNSFIGFGANMEHLKVNCRDCRVWYEYTEVGTIGSTKFFKLRWGGNSHYSATDDASAMWYDVFLLDNGQIYLNWYDVPTSYFDSGVKALACGSETVSFTATAGVASEYTFTPTSATTGTGWTVSNGRPTVVVNRKPNGNTIYKISGITGTTAKSSLSWTQIIPEGTTISVFTSRDGASWTPISNGGSPFAPKTSLSNADLYIKIEMATTVATSTPEVSNLRLLLQIEADTYSLILEMQPLQRFESAAGNIVVGYDGAGSLSGKGGAVVAFSKSFAPTELVWKGDQNDLEQISISDINVVPNLIRIYYLYAQCIENIQFSIDPHGILTHINDI